MFFHPLFVAFCTPLKPKIGQKEPFFWHFPPFYYMKKTEFWPPFDPLLTFLNDPLLRPPFWPLFTKKQVAATLREQASQRPLKSNITVIYLCSFRVSGAAIRVFSRKNRLQSCLFRVRRADGRHRRSRQRLPAHLFPSVAVKGMHMYAFAAAIRHSKRKDTK